MTHRDGPGIAVALAAAILAGGVVLADGLLTRSRDSEAAAGLRQARGMALEQEAAGSASVWRDTERGITAVITPAVAWQGQDGRWCRSYSLEMIADGHAPAAPRRHLACRTGSGGWITADDEHAATPDSAVARWFDRLTGGVDELAENGG